MKEKDKKREERLQVKNNFKAGSSGGMAFFTRGNNSQGLQRSDHSIKFHFEEEKSSKIMTNLDLNSKSIRPSFQLPEHNETL